MMKGPADMTAYRAEHVGSLLRPPALLAARDAWQSGRITGEQLLAEEDRAAKAAIDLQAGAGIEVFTEGEVRRGTFMAGLTESLGGVSAVPAVQNDVRWRRTGMADPSAADTHIDGVAASGKLHQKRALTTTEASFLSRHAPGPFKITMMSASMGLSLWHPGITEQVYPSPDEMLADLVRLQIEEIEGLVALGTRWIQLDSLSYNWVIDTELSESFAAATGITPTMLLDLTVGIDAQVVRAAKAMNPDVTVGLHFCRGNNRSAWMAEGGYESIAERLFNEVEADRFLLEYDSERAGGFEPLRYMPASRTVVLGLISTKTPALESQDALVRRIDHASAYVPLDDLAISPQCGFASTARGNLLTDDDQRRKLELVVQTAARVWGLPAPA
jgi:5-methyltetrahydropteroyltriglutamate--homocysteine methyltransferase